MCTTTMELTERDELILLYFDIGLSYKDITSILFTEHGMAISDRHLKRILRHLNLRRRQYDNLEDVVHYINGQLRTSGRLHGYRMMYMKCKVRGLRARMEHVRLALRQLDPEGTQIRASRRLHRRDYFAKGPNFIWHLDGYDKLKPFGLCINGCICGFSRYIIWLNVYNTNSNPRVIGGYFLEAIQRERGCPKIVRADFGTENVTVRALQNFFKTYNRNEVTTTNYIEGASTANQRIECWWATFRRQNTSFWIEMFRGLQERGYFDGGFLDKGLVQFCFTSIIQEELDTVAAMWNDHSIRPSTNRVVPSGKPSQMYLVPSLWGATNEICGVTQDKLDQVISEVQFRSVIPCDQDIYNACIEIMKRDRIYPPGDVEEANNLYLHLREQIHILL